jgi:hypothetical protein
MSVSSRQTPREAHDRRLVTEPGEATPLQAVDEPTPRLSAALLAARFLGASSVLAVGAVHLQQYDYLYSSVPTIGTLFLLNFLGATAIGLGLLAPLERTLGRLGSAAVGLLAVGGIGLAATAFTFLFVSERTPLFGFQEPGYDPPAIMAARVAEVVTVVALSVYLAARFAWKWHAARW